MTALRGLGSWTSAGAATTLAFFGFVRLATAQPLTVEEPATGRLVSFETDVLPALRKNCLACHSASEKQGELVLESPESMRKGGDSGPAIVPGKSGESLLLAVASHAKEPIMPPADNDVAAANLTPQELGLLKLWIDQGALGSASIAGSTPQRWLPLPPGVHPALAVALSRDGQIAACSRANRIYLYHVPTGALLTQLDDPSLADPNAAGLPGIAHRDLVQSLAFNPEGDLLASGGFREAKLWRRPRDVERLRIATGSPVTALADSPDGARIATADATGKIRLWNAADGVLVAEIAGHEGQVRSLAFSRDSTKLASASLDRSVRLWNATDGAPAGRIDTPAAPNAVEFIRSALPTNEAPSPVETLVTGEEDNSLRAWNVPSGPSAKLASVPAATALATFSRDRKLLATATAEGVVTIARVQKEDDTPADEPVASFPVEGGVAALAFVGASPTAAADQAAAATIAVATKTGTIRLHALAGGAPIAEWRGGSEALATLAATPAGDWLATGGADGQIDLWRVAAAPIPAGGMFIGGTAETFWLSPSRKLAATLGVRDGQRAVTLWDVATGQATKSIPAAEGPALFAFAGNETRVATVSSEGALKVYDVAATPPNEVAAHAGLATGATALAMNADGSQALVAAPDGSLKLANVADGAIAVEAKGHAAPAIVVGFRQGQLYSVSGDRSVRFWNPADGAQLRAIDLPAIPTASTLSVDENRIAVALEDGKVRVVNAADGGAPLELLGLAKPASRVAFSSDGTLLIASTDAGDVRIWEAATGKTVEAFVEPGLVAAGFAETNERTLLALGVGGMQERRLRFARRLDAGTQPIVDVVFSNDGQRLFMAAKDGSFRGYDVSNGTQAFATGHGASVADLALSPDGAILATGGENRQVRLWRNDGGGFGPTQIADLPGPAVAVAFSADSTRVLIGVAGDKPQQVICDVQTGAVLERRAEQTETALALAAYEDASVVSVVASEARRGTMHFRKAIPGHSQPVTSLAADAVQPMQVWSGSRDGTLRRWNVQSGQQLVQLNHGGAVTDIAVHPDGERVGSTSDSATAKLWRSNGQQIGEMRGDLRRKTALANQQQRRNVANSRLDLAKRTQTEAEQDVPLKTEAEKKLSESLAAANKDVADKTAAVEAMRVAKVAAEKGAIDASAAAKTALAAKEQAESAAKLAADAAKASQDRLTRLNQVAASLGGAATMQAKLDAATAEVQTLQTASQQAAAAVASPAQAAQQAAMAADAAAKVAADGLKPYNDALAALVTSQTAQNLLAQQQAIAARELKAAQDLVPVRMQEATDAEATLKTADEQLAAATVAAQQADLPLRSVAFSPDGALVLTAGDFPSVHAWDATTGLAVSAYAGHEGPIASVALAGDDGIVSASADGTVRVWETNPAWKLERTIGAADDPATIVHRVTAVDFSADSAKLLVGSGAPSRSGELAVFDVADGKRTLHLPAAHDDVVYSARFSPDGRRIASCGADKYLRTFDAATGEQLRRYEGHTNYVLGVDWKGDGRTIATAGADVAVKVWDAATGDQQRTIDQEFAKHVTALRFVGDRDEFVTSGGDRRVRMKNAANGGTVRNFPEAKAWLHAVDVTPDGKVVAAGDAEGRLYLFNGENSQPLHVIEPPGKEAKAAE